MQPKLKIKFPFVESFNDYHSITYKMDDLNEVLTPKVKSAEIGFDGNYWGLFYVGKKPSKKVVDSMLKSAGFVEET